jgi:hypothetical protein
VKVLLNSGRTFATGDPASGSQSTRNGVRVSPIRMHRLTAAQVLLNWTGEDAGSMGVKSLELIRITGLPVRDDRDCVERRRVHSVAY